MTHCPALVFIFAPWICYSFSLSPVFKHQPSSLLVQLLATPLTSVCYVICGAREKWKRGASHLKSRRKSFFFLLLWSLLIRHDVFNLLFDVALPHAQGYLRNEWDPVSQLNRWCVCAAWACLVPTLLASHPGPNQGHRVLVVTEGMWLLGEPAAEKQGAGGEKQDCLRVQALSSCFMISPDFTYKTQIQK